MPNPTLRVHVKAIRGLMMPPGVFDASVLMLTRDEQGELMLTFVTNRQTHVVRYQDVLKVDVIR